VSEGQGPRFWTVDEARAYLPRLRVLLAAVRGHVEMAGRARSNGHGAGAGQAPTGADNGEEAVDAASAVAELEASGIVLRAVDRGLVDFPARHAGGRVVLLCWQVGEDDLGWWHLPEDGFAGRRPLPLPPEL
jgi:hypothetical protein